MRGHNFAAESQRALTQELTAKGTVSACWMRSLGHSQCMLDEMLDHKSDDTAIKQAEDFAVGSKGEH